MGHRIGRAGLICSDPAGQGVPLVVSSAHLVIERQGDRLGGSPSAA